MQVSLIIPAYNEQEVLPLLRARVDAVTARLPEYQFEIVIVDDRSRDETPQLLAQWARADTRVHGLRLARNCGSHAAIMAGLQHCTGDCAIVMAADLQDPPELIGELLGRWRVGYQVVWGVRAARQGEALHTRLFSALYWRLMRSIALPQTPAQGADVFLLDRAARTALTGIREQNTSCLSLLMWLGFRQTHVEYVKAERVAGRSGWTFAKRMKLLIDSVVSFSTLPIRATWLGGLTFLGVAGLWSIGIPLAWLLGTSAVSAATFAIIGILLLGFGLGLTMLGVLGEYLWRAYDEVRGRPRYTVECVFTQQPSRFVADARPQVPTATPLAVPSSVKSASRSAFEPEPVESAQ